MNSGKLIRQLYAAQYTATDLASYWKNANPQRASTYDTIAETLRIERERVRRLQRTEIPDEPQY